MIISGWSKIYSWDRMPAVGKLDTIGVMETGSIFVMLLPVDEITPFRYMAPTQYTIGAVKLG